MSNPIAGWYPDPSGDSSRLRYWDGGAWTEHFAEALPPANAPVSNAAPPAHTGQWSAGAGEVGASPWHVPQQSSGTGSYPGASAQSSAPSLVWAQDGGSNPYSPGGSIPGGTPGGEDRGSRTGLVIGIVLGALLLIAGIVVTAIVLLGRAGDPDTVSRPTPVADAPAGPRLADGGVVEVGTPVSGSLPANGEWTATFSVAEESVVVLDVRSTDDADLALEVTGPDGVELANDDRDDVFDDSGSGWLDPALGARLAPGEYSVSLTEYSGEASGFVLALEAPELVDVGTVPVDIPAAGRWLAAIELPADGVYVFDAVSTGDVDPVLTVSMLDGDYFTSDDSTEGAGSGRDPYLRDLFAPGLYFIGMTEWNGEPASIELTIVAE